LEHHQRRSASAPRSAPHTAAPRANTGDRRFSASQFVTPARAYQTGASDLDGDRRKRFTINDDAVIRRW